MEKIYMEEQHQGKKGKFSRKAKVSIVLSFMVAIFAVVSLIAAGFNSMSYAAPTDVDSFTFYQANAGGTTQGINLTAKDANGQIFTFPYYKANNEDYSSTDGFQIFCIEHNKSINQGAQYTKDSDSLVEDQGLLYILNKSRRFGGDGIVSQEMITFAAQTIGEDEAYVGNVLETYATQIAIWVYMHDKYYVVDSSRFPSYSLETPASDTATAKTDAENLAIIKGAVTIDAGVDGKPEMNFSGNNFYDTFIAPVVSAAMSSTSPKSLKITKADNSISKVGDDGFYQTPELKVEANPANDLLSYDVSISGIDGAIIVDSQGNTKNHFDVKSGDSTSFFVRVPVNKVSESNQSGTVTVNAIFDNYISARIYQSGDLQKVVAVTGKTGPASTSISVDFVGAPNLGMSKAQTIYFIGLIVLLCGVGIIYANAKPAQSEE